jgi:hypothetical protein
MKIRLPLHLLLPAVVVVGVGVGCGGPPWYMGKPLDGRPSIPPRTARPVPEEARASAIAARAAHRPVLELAALSDLAALERLSGPETARFIELLEARAATFAAMGRGIPRSADLETVAQLDPARGAALAPARAAAATAAGDAWKAIGAHAEARAAYARAAALGGIAAGPFPASVLPAPPLAPPTARLPVDLDGWLYGGPVLSARLLPLAVAFPSILDDVPRALVWVDLLLAEDPSSPDVRELSALVFGRARRFGGTERMLMELAYYSPDRAAGLARGARVWDRLGRSREACAQWIRAARWRDDPEDPAWQRAVSCSRRDPGAGDWQAIRAYVLARAAVDRRAAIAAALDGQAAPALDGQGAPALDGQGAPALNGQGAPAPPGKPDAGQPAPAAGAGAGLTPIRPAR